jgi:hypothetical protein
MVRREEEFWVFDLSDTVNGIGGALGLFLGWSGLYLANQFVIVIRKIVNSFSLVLLSRKEEFLIKTSTP